jgi:hypothetical protein
MEALRGGTSPWRMSLSSQLGYVTRLEMSLGCYRRATESSRASWRRRQPGRPRGTAAAPDVSHYWSQINSNLSHLIRTSRGGIGPANLFLSAPLTQAWFGWFRCWVAIKLLEQLVGLIDPTHGLHGATGIGVVA